jgi:hypothetical protein
MTWEKEQNRTKLAQRRPPTGTEKNTLGGLFPKVPRRRLVGREGLPIIRPCQKSSRIGCSFWTAAKSPPPTFRTLKAHPELRYYFDGLTGGNAERILDAAAENAERKGYGKRRRGKAAGG